MDGFLAGPHVVFGTSNYLSAWTDAASHHPASASDVYAQFVSPAGSLVGNALPVSDAPGGQELRGAAFDGTNFLLIWASTDGLSGRRLSPSGELLGEELAFTTENVEQAAAVAFGGGQFLVAWMEGTDGNHTAKGRFVSPCGAVGSVLTLSQIQSHSHHPISVGWGAERFMVLWHHNAHADADWNLRGRMVLPDGTMAGDELILTSGSNDVFAWANNVVFDGQCFLVVWTEWVGSLTNGNGTVLGRYWNLDAEPVGDSFAIDPEVGGLAAGLSAGAGRTLAFINAGAFTSESDVYARFIERPFVQVAQAGPDGFRMIFNGVLECSTNLQTWIDYAPQPPSPWTLSIGEHNLFFRVRGVTSPSSNQ